MPYTKSANNLENVVKKRFGVARPIATSNHIELDFYLPAGTIPSVEITTRRKEALRVNGVTIPAYDGKNKLIGGNMAHARRVLDSIYESIVRGKFNYEDFFQESEWLRKLRSKLADRGTVETDLRAWFRKHEAEFKSTKKSYRLAVEAWIKEEIDGQPFGKLKTVSVSPENLETIIYRWKTKLTIKTITNKKIPISRMFDEAIISRRIPINPFNLLPESVFKKTVAQQEQEAIQQSVKIAFDLMEISALLAVAKPAMRNFLLLAFWAGMRTGELFALAWEDIDFVNGTIKVWLGYTESVLSTPKTKESRRILFMDELAPAVREALMDQKKLTFMQEAINTKFGPRRSVFLRPSGKPWTDDHQLRPKVWKKLIEKSGVHYLPPYHTRHTFASLMLAAGEDKEWIRKILGHKKDSKMLEKHYAELLEHAAKMAGRVGGSKGKALWEAINAESMRASSKVCP